MTLRDVCVKRGDALNADADQSDDGELAAQMEWDPQTDVASPMLPLQGLTRDSFLFGGEV